MWGRKEKKENMERRKKKQQGHISEKIHLERNMMRAKNGRREEQHYLRERAAPGGQAYACGSFRVRCCWVGDGVGELRLPSLGVGAARPALGPWSWDGVGD